MSLNNKKILITGANGLLGQVLRLFLEKHGFVVIATGLGSDRLRNHNHIYKELDVTSLEQCAYVINKYEPSVIVNAAAMTNVDECEISKTKCLAVNSSSIDNFIPHVINYKIHLIQISTDFVFNGFSGGYVENDACNPLNNYGISKLSAEKNIKNHLGDELYTIIRTSLIYGPGENNFLAWARTKLETGDILNIVHDQYRTPTYVNDLALAILRIIELKKYGLYHISSGEKLSIFDIVCNIALCLRLDLSKINKINSRELNQIASRPSDSTLDIDKAIKELGFAPTKLNNALKNIL
tara:strand:+ start:32644 stop:33531 length:888 start_codon:yes stop_codon:yes gene_type:complete